MRTTSADFAVLSLDKVADVDAHEGPVYVESEHALYFTTLPKPDPRSRSSGWTSPRASSGSSARPRTPRTG
jgi:hypothetical protein